MTDRAKRKRKKTEFGADSEADRILDKLPRINRGDLSWRGRSAFLSIDDSGRLLIGLDGDGMLIINEKDLIKVHGDELADF